MIELKPDLLAINSICKSYREGDEQRQVLNRVDLSAKQGQIIALLGESGAGKSTLLNIVSGIDHPDSGTVTFADQELTTLGEPTRTTWRRQNIGIVFQFFNLIPTLTVEENLRLPLDLNQLTSTQSRRHASSLLERIGLATRSHDFIDLLSGGEQQRLAVARALVHRPAILLADEPTGNLDPATGQQVLNLMHELCREQSTTALIVTHSDTVAARADRRLRLANGRLTESAGESLDLPEAQLGDHSAEH